MIETQKLGEGEKIIKVMKGHEIYFFSLGSQFFVFLVCVVGLYYFFSHKEYIFLSIIVFFQIFFVYLYKKLMSYEFNKLIITNQRILGFFRISFFEYEFFETPLSEVSEIKGKTQGFFSNHFGYGNLEVRFKEETKSFFVFQAKDILKNASLIHQTMRETKKGI